MSTISTFSHLDTSLSSEPLHHKLALPRKATELFPPPGMLPIEQQQTSGQVAGTATHHQSEYRVLFPSQQYCRSHPSEGVCTPAQQLNSVPHLIPPRSHFAHAVLMGNAASDQAGEKRRTPNTTQTHPSSDPTRMLNQQPMTQSNPQSHTMPKSNLSVLLEEQRPRDDAASGGRTAGDVLPCTCDRAVSSVANTPSSSSSKHDEADSASGPPPPPPPSQLTNSAPAIITAQMTKRRFSSTSYVIGTPPIALHDQCPVHDSSILPKQPPRAEATGSNDSVRR